MEENSNLALVMNCDTSYVLKRSDGQVTSQGECNVILDIEKLKVLPLSGESLLIPYRDIIKLSGANYRIEVTLVSGEILTIFNIGHKYEDFLRNFSNLNNDVILKDLLMNETVIKSGIEAEYKYIDENKIEKTQGLCELRIYETGLVIINGDGDFIRIPYSDIVKVYSENYRLIINTDYEETFIFSKMGKGLDVCYKLMNDLINKLSVKIQLMLKELFPVYDASIIRKAAGFMKEGRAARRSDIESIYPVLWEELEKKLEACGIKEEYEYLKSIGQSERICIGIKRGLAGDLTGEYIWFLVPIFSVDNSKPGNAIAMEATSIEGSGKATYFFRIIDNVKYSGFKDPAELQLEADKAVKIINRHLISVNFRREPIYLTDDQLLSPVYVGYQRSIARIPAIRELRCLFIGRVIHHSPEQWKNDVLKLLESNVKIS